jgi:hypothetical protein
VPLAGGEVVRRRVGSQAASAQWSAGGGVGGPGGYGGRVRPRTGEKKLYFGRNALQIAIFPIYFQKHMTGGSNVRGKSDPNWVRKVFNCLRSL